MRIVLFFLAVGITQALALGSYGQNTRLNLKFNNEEIAKILDRIEDQSEFYFMYDATVIDVNQRKSIDCENSTISKILDELFQGTGITYRIDDRQIALKRAPEISNATLNQVNQQQKTVSGKVTDSSGSPLPGVTVVVKGTTTGTITDPDGNFSMPDVSSDAILIFSFVGMKTQEIPVATNTVINITMFEDAIGIEEVVAIGYGMVKKSDLTGSITSVSSEDIVQMPTQRVDQALQGRAAGVLVTNTDGSPGGNTTIRIRGSNSILGGNDALIVLDGVQGVKLNTINPNDIESIEILKDASATAIYGSQGANGVVLITTKKGVEGKPLFSYSFSYGVQNLSKRLDLMGAADYARTVNAQRALSNASNEVTPPPAFTEQEIAEFEKNGGTDWQDEIFRQAPIQNHQLSVRGGAKTFKYFVSGGYLNHDGILINSKYSRYTIRANMNMDINKWLTFGLNLSNIKERGSSPAFGGESAVDNRAAGAISVAVRYAPTAKVKDENGNYLKPPADYGPRDTWNPVASARGEHPVVKTLNNSVNAYLDFKLLSGLTLRVNGVANLSNSQNTDYFDQDTYNGRPQNGKVGAAIVSYGEYQGYQNTNILTYDKKFGFHKITLSGVAEQTVSKWYGNYINASQFAVDQTGYNDLSGADQIKVSTSENKRVLKSYLGRVNYIFNDKYLCTISMRADGSSVFGENNKWGYFPAASVAWRISEEPFIKALKVISNLKLRASYGVTGNQAISPYQSLPLVRSGGDWPGTNYPYDGAATTNIGYAIYSSGNPNLKWEKTDQTDFGLDFGLFEGRFTGTFDVYKKTTSNLLLYRQLPGSTGLTRMIDNVGSTENKGLEITLGGDPLIGSFKWNTGFNISINKNLVVDLGDDIKIPYQVGSSGENMSDALMWLHVGERFGTMYGWKDLGIWSTSEAAQAYEYGQLPGDIHYLDLNDDKVIDYNDITKIGKSQPKFIFGWSNRFSYRNFELSMLIQGSYGNDIFSMVRVLTEASNWGDATMARMLNKWTPDNQNTDIPAFTDHRTRELTGAWQNKLIGVDGRTSRYVEDGSYVRLKNITLSYNVKSIRLSDAGIKNLRVYVSGNNLITITDYMGFDPEVSSFNSNDAMGGVDSGNYPSAKVITFGIDLTF